MKNVFGLITAMVVIAGLTVLGEAIYEAGRIDGYEKRRLEENVEFAMPTIDPLTGKLRNYRDQ